MPAARAATLRILPLGLGLLALGAALSSRFPAATVEGEDPPQIGYDDTPQLPGSPWRVHDGKRPQPRVAEPPPLVSAAPPVDAVVLFDGKDLSAWRGREGDARWTVEDGAMIVNGTGDIESIAPFSDVQLHIEWATPAEPKGDSQGRGNSGVFLMGRYEIQVLDSWHNPTYPDGQAGALYGQRPPLVNASRPPGEWQSYDILFQAPRFEGESLLAPARVTVLHNGICVQSNAEFLGATTHRELARYDVHPVEAPIRLQDHGNPVRFRNVWARDLSSR
jgi:hypothetical protein